MDLLHHCGGKYYFMIWWYISRGSLVSDEGRMKFSKLGARWPEWVCGHGDMFLYCRIQTGNFWFCFLWYTMANKSIDTKHRIYNSTTTQNQKINHEEQAAFLVCFSWSRHRCVQCCISACPCPKCQKHPIAIALFWKPHSWEVLAHVKLFDVVGAREFVQGFLMERLFFSQNERWLLVNRSGLPAKNPDPGPNASDLWVRRNKSPWMFDVCGAESCDLRKHIHCLFFCPTTTRDPFDFEMMPCIVSLSCHSIHFVGIAKPWQPWLMITPWICVPWWFSTSPHDRGKTTIIKRLEPWPCIKVTRIRKTSLQSAFGDYGTVVRIEAWWGSKLRGKGWFRYHQPPQTKGKTAFHTQVVGAWICM